MELKITSILLLILPLSVFSQEVILESEKMNAEQKRVAQVEETLRELEKDYDNANQEYNKVFSKLRPLEVVLNPTKEKLEKKIQDIEDVQYEMQRQSLKEKCRQINTLKNSIGDASDYCPSLERKSERLEEQHKKIRKQLSDFNQGKAKKETEEMQHAIEISNLDKEIASLDEQLANSKVEEPKKKKSLDDFLAEKGISNTKPNKKKSLDDLLETKTSNNSNGKKSNSLDDLLASSTNKNKSKSNSLDDMLDDKGNNKAKENNLDALIAEKESNTDFKIDYKNGLTGVVNSKGQVLIPYREWDIIEFKLGIAKVRKRINESYSNENCSFSAYKEGFVDSNGSFIDGFSIEGDYGTYGIKSGFFLIAGSPTEAERKRMNDKRNKENSIKRKKCEVEYNSWIRTIKSRYR